MTPEDDTGRRGSPRAARNSRHVLLAALVILAAALWAAPSVAQETEAGDGDLTELSLEELMNVEVTSVAKVPERLFLAPAAVEVITSEDLRRAGVSRIPEALRMVPGVEVARVNANKWAVGIRGFNDLFTNKLLVLVDGRSVYTPLFSGVFWDSLDLPIDDVERIEVIRGPGAPLWGANAVNGIINIITKHSRDTRGGLVRVGVGTEDDGLGVLRYGGRLGEAATYRVYGKLFAGSAFEDADGEPAADDWRVAEGGFRLDWDPGGDDRVMMSGQWFDNRAETTYRPPTVRPPFVELVEDDAAPSGGHLLGRWSRDLSGGSRITGTASYTRADRDDAVLGNLRNTIEMDLEHEALLGSRHHLLWGARYRLNSDDLLPTTTVAVDDTERTDQLFSGFLQDRISLAGGDVELTLGSKFEHNDYTGFEIQPGVRLLWSPSRSQAVWGAVTRAVRTPSRAEADFHIGLNAFVDPGTGLPVLATAQGNEEFGSEELVAFEVGYRARPAPWATVDLAAFVNDYDDLRTIAPLEPRLRLRPVPHVELPFLIVNANRGRSRGFEATVRLRPHERLRLRTGYSFLDLDIESGTDSGPIDAFSTEGASPRHQAQLLSELVLSPTLDLDTNLYYVDELPAFDVPAYTRLDVRLGWRPRPELELSLVGRDLLDERHPEFGSSFLGAVATRLPRSWAAYLVWHIP